MSASKALEAPGANAPFSLNPILVDLEGAQYVGPILLIPLTYILVRWRTIGGYGNVGDSSGISDSIRNGSGRSSGGGGNRSSGTALKKRLVHLRGK